MTLKHKIRHDYPHETDKQDFDWREDWNKKMFFFIFIILQTECLKLPRRLNIFLQNNK